MSYRRGESRSQAALFPVMLDDLVAPDSLIRVVDAWVESLDLAALGFGKTITAGTGRPPYAPADLLKLYVAGYLNGVRSSRALERECHRNVECMWLLGRLAPDHKTIADFRKVNSAALVAASVAFVQFARREHLISGAIVAIDGSKIRAVASSKSVGKLEDLERERQSLSEHAAQYLQQLDAADIEASQAAAPKREVITRALSRLQQRQREIDDEVVRIEKSRSTLSVQTEVEARSMRSLHGAPGYNLQTAVDTESHLIVHHEVCNDGNDLHQLAPMAQATAAVLEASPTLVADAGYANGEHLHTLATAGMSAYVAPNHGGNGQGGGLFYERTHFAYDAVNNHFVCPANKILKRKQLAKKDNCVIYMAQASDCAPCEQRGQCTNAKQRSVSRHLYEDALIDNAMRVAETPHMMALRRQTVEHPFGTIKHQILRNARLLVRGLKGARAELSLAVLAYNFKRVSNMKGNNWVMSAVRA